LGLGLLRRFALPGVEMHEGLLSVETVQSWLHSYYFPYHRTLKEILDEKVAFLLLVYIFHIITYDLFAEMMRR
jgi:N-formylglutamate amidohydrolase